MLANDPQGPLKILWLHMVYCYAIGAQFNLCVIIPLCNVDMLWRMLVGIEEELKAVLHE